MRILQTRGFLISSQNFVLDDGGCTNVIASGVLIQGSHINLNFLHGGRIKGIFYNSVNVNDSSYLVVTRGAEAVIFQLLPLPHLSLPLPITKSEKTTVDNFFSLCGSVACLLLHFMISTGQKPSFIPITLPTSLEHIVPNYSVFLFLRY